MKNRRIYGCLGCAFLAWVMSCSGSADMEVKPSSEENEIRKRSALAEIGGISTAFPTAKDILQIDLMVQDGFPPNHEPVTAAITRDELESVWRLLRRGRRIEEDRLWDQSAELRLVYADKRTETVRIYTGGKARRTIIEIADTWYEAEVEHSAIRDALLQIVERRRDNR